MYLKSILKACWVIPLTVLPLSTFAQTAPVSNLNGAENDEKRTVTNDNLIRIPQSVEEIPGKEDGVADNTTGIEDIVRVDQRIPGTRFADGVYNLNGQKVGTTADSKHLSAGIYIVNGIKHIIK